MSIGMKAIGMALLLLMFGSVALYFLLPSEACLPQVTISRIDSSAREVDKLIQQNAKYESQIKALENTNRILQAKINHQRINQPSQSHTPATDKVAQADSNSLAEFAQQREVVQSAEELSSYMGAFNSANEINQDLKKKFEAEAVDYSWAIDYESKLGQLFTIDQNLSSFVPEGITCKTTRCQIKIPISSFDESNEAMKAISQAFNSKATGIGETTIITIPDPSLGFVDFYIARDKDVKLYQ